VSVPPSGETADLEETDERLERGAAYHLVDVDVVTVSGPDAGSWLQGQLTQDLDPILPGASAETLVLSPQGRVDGYGAVARTDEETWLLVTVAGRGAGLLERLRRFKLRVKATLVLDEMTAAAVRGPEAVALAASLIESGPALAGLEVRWPNWEGVDLVFAGHGPGHAPGSPAAGAPAAFEARRIEAGVPRIGHEITERTIPHEAGLLVDHTVSFTKGCYTGQELVARIDARGANVPRRLRLVTIAADRGQSPAPAAGNRLLVGSAPAGELTSVAWSPAKAAFVALAYVKRGTTVPSEVEIDVGAGASRLGGNVSPVPGSSA
jgi:folate-binding protein YgfZ